MGLFIKTLVLVILIHLLNLFSISGQNVTVPPQYRVLQYYGGKFTAKQKLKNVEIIRQFNHESIRYKVDNFTMRSWIFDNGIQILGSKEIIKLNIRMYRKNIYVERSQFSS